MAQPTTTTQLMIIRQRSMLTSFCGDLRKLQFRLDLLVTRGLCRVRDLTHHSE